MQITHVVVHTPEQVREILREAATIADEHADDASTKGLIFKEACRLLGQRFTLAYEPQAVQLPAMAIPGNKRH